MERWEGLPEPAGGISGFLCGDPGEGEGEGCPAVLGAALPLVGGLVLPEKGKEVCFSITWEERGNLGLLTRDSITTHSSSLVGVSSLRWL